MQQQMRVKMDCSGCQDLVEKVVINDDIRHHDGSQVMIADK